MTTLISSAETLLGSPLTGAKRLHGGDLSEVLEAQLPDGRSVVIKGGPNPRAEADMLRSLKAAGTPTPDVVAVNDTVLVLTKCDDGGDLARSWKSLAAALTTVHSTHGDTYGWLEDYAFGAVPIPNTPSDNWPNFWAQNRLLCHEGHVPTALMHRIEALCGRLASLVPETPSPSLLHGDLWSGNILCSQGVVTGLIDPACYHGHGEVDVAMLCLFSTPGDAFWAHYARDELGFSERQAIYQLWPALVHLRLFGSGYAGLVERCLAQVGA
ncbi:MAG: fructosamine kinase family protein [Pseudomonadota bacterium]